jgi:23S rRNA (uracil1939-C5)-methyltransferase
MGRRFRKPKLPQGDFEAQIQSLSHDGKGVARIDEKATFIQGALAGEKITFRYTNRKKSYDEGLVTSVIEASPDRVQPKCAHYEICGGCSLQHLDADKQIEAKQQVLLDNLEHIGKVSAQSILPPLTNDSVWGYRRKARLGVKNVPKKGKVLVGFRERASSFVADLTLCPVLHPRVGELLPQLSELVEGLSINAKLPQVEVAMDDDQCVLIFRILEDLTDTDAAAIKAFGEAYDIIPYTQRGGPDTVIPLSGIPADLHYALPDQNLELGFLPGDFTQVNTDINRKMINRALDMLDLNQNDTVLDLFCGVGNFTLPLATQAGTVVGVEGDEGLVQRAKSNAERNKLANVDFYAANLYEELKPQPWLNQHFTKALIDPPRSGALEILPLINKMGIETLLYISCYPGTLARDAGVLVNEMGYTLVSAGVMDMFPHTGHVESIALFKK